MSYQHRPLSKTSDWPFFDADSSISEDERALIWPLSSVSAWEFWQSHIAREPLERHPMLLPVDHWLKPTVQGPSWLIEKVSGSSRYSEGSDVELFLNRSFCLNYDERVYFVLMKEHVYSIPMRLFAQHWRDFLYLGDEGPFLFHPETKAFVCFHPNGQLSFGKKLDQEL